MWQPLAPQPDDVHQRLDQVLARRLARSRGAVRRLLDAGGVRLNGRPVDGSAKGRIVTAADRIELADQALHDAPRPMPDQPLDVVSQGDGWLIVNKPAGMPAHPLRTGETDTVLNAVAARYPQIIGIGEGGLRSGVVHRLDVGTTGCLLMATAQPTWDRLRQAFRQRQVEKIYHALVHGKLHGQADVSAHLAITRHRPAHVSVVDRDHADSRRCTLHWRSLIATETASLLEVHLGTGFLHQIRAMCAHLGHPLLGDTAYGGAQQVAGTAGPRPVARPMLHARSLRVDEITGRVDPPPDFQELSRVLQLMLRDAGPASGGH